jgi:hypothetical protein
VFDYPNIAATWSRVREHKVLGEDVNWLELKRFLKNHAQQQYGKDIETQFRIFKNRWSNRNERARAKWFRDHGFTLHRKYKDIETNSDIDDDIVSYVESETQKAKIFAVYLIGNDFRNYIPLTYKLDELCIDSWLGYLESGLCEDHYFDGLAELTGLIDLESQTSSVFLLSDDYYHISNDRPREMYKTPAQGRRSKNGKRAYMRKRQFDKFADDSTLK